MQDQLAVQCMLTKIVDEIMEQKQGKVNEEFRYLDPKILRGPESGQVFNPWSQSSA